MTSHGLLEHAAPAFIPQPQRRPGLLHRRPRARRGVAGGVVDRVAVLNRGRGLNIAVLRLNVRLDKLNAQRMQLRADKQALSSQLSLAAASPRIQALAHRQGLVPADPTQTTYVRLGPGPR
jgi:hypothetical protein